MVQFGAGRLVQIKPERREFCANALQDLRQIIVPSRSLEQRCAIAANCSGEAYQQDINILEERPDELEESVPVGESLNGRR